MLLTFLSVPSQQPPPSSQGLLRHFALMKKGGSFKLAVGCGRPAAPLRLFHANVSLVLFLGFCWALPPAVTRGGMKGAWLGVIPLFPSGLDFLPSSLADLPSARLLGDSRAQPPSSQQSVASSFLLAPFSEHLHCSRNVPSVAEHREAKWLLPKAF